jgi:ubiquitin C-terminal hydrolase
MNYINVNYFVLIRFPNPLGTNKCWMNSSLQAIFGMKPFIEHILNVFEKSNIVGSREKYSSLLEKFIEVVKARERGNQLQLNRNLEYVHVQSWVVTVMLVLEIY